MSLLTEIAGKRFRLEGLLKISCRAAVIGSAAIVPFILHADGPPGSGTAKPAYDLNCASCHGTAFQGRFGPALIGRDFTEKWKMQPGEMLLDYIKAKMPPLNPGTLDDDSYAQITNLLLEVNSIPSLSTSQIAGWKSRKAKPADSKPADPDPFATSNDAIYRHALERRKAMLQRLTPLTDTMLTGAKESDWAVWRRTPDSLGYSPLKQINRKNVSGLRLAWSRSLSPGTNGIAPLVHDGVIFFNASGKVSALDATSGEMLWEYAGSEAPSPFVPISQPRGIALYGDKVFVPTMDGRMIALDMRTGALVWEKRLFTPEDGLQLTAAPLAIRGKIIQGVAGCYSEIHRGGCFIIALDAASGEEKWRFNTIARGDQPGANSWNGAQIEERYGAAIWNTASYDAGLNLLFFGTSQTYKVSTLLAPKRGESSDALFTNSTIALDPDTGHLAWYFQHLPGDVWDLDYAFERSLITLNEPGGPRRIVVTGGKDGIFDALDARTGRYLFSSDMGIQTLVKSIDPKTGRKMINPPARYSAGHITTVCPYVGGGRNWPATSYDPNTHLLFVPMTESCMDITAPEKSTEFSAGWKLKPRPDSDGKFGRIAALDVEKKRIAWINRRRAPPSSAMLATAGGLLFEGSRDRTLRALDSATGAQLWETPLSDPANSFPISYSVDGIQYVAVILGGNTPLDTIFRSFTPEIENSSGARSIWVFKLPSR